MSGIERVPTGIPGFDEVIGGGFPRNSVILVAGHPGVGKTTFAAHFIYTGVTRYGEPGVYVSFSESREEFYRHTSMLGMRFDRLTEDKFRFIEAINIADKGSIANLFSWLLNSIKELGAKRLVIDSLTAVTLLLEMKDVRTFLHSALMKVLKKQGITAIFTADLPFGSETVGHGIEEFVADGVILLKLTSHRGFQRRTLIIEKLKGTPTRYRAYEFIITDNGIRVYVPEDGEFGGGLWDETLSTGVPGLDEMLGGKGVKKGSVTLISGPSGTGKTILSLLFVLEGIREGKRGVFITFNEPKRQIYYHIRKLGFDPEKVGGNLKVFSINPYMYTPGAFYYKFRRILEQYNPERLVIDGIDVLEGLYDYREYREMCRNIVLLAKASGTTSIVTTLHNIIEGDSKGVTHLVDNIIALWLELGDGIIRHRIAIIKQRGTSNPGRIGLLVIGDGVVCVKPEPVKGDTSD